MSSRMRVPPYQSRMAGGQRDEDRPERFRCRASTTRPQISWRAMRWLLRGELAGLGALAGEAADDAHAAEGLGGVAVDVLAAGPDVAVQRADAADPGAMREIHDRQQQQRPEQQPPIDPGQDDQAAEQLDDRPPGVVEHGEDQLGDAAGVFAEDAGHAAAT